jgi:predicted MPP superfamily phosphohydrolase
MRISASYLASSKLPHKLVAVRSSYAIVPLQRRKMSPTTVKTKIFIISDTHSSDRRDLFTETHSFQPPFPKVDVLLHTGDLTGTGKIGEHKAAIELLAQIPAELKLVIAGNHDLNLDKEYYLDGEGSAARVIDRRNYSKESVDVAEELWKGKAAKDAGITYLDEGIHSFKLSNGAQFTVYASEWQPECK